MTFDTEKIKFSKQPQTLVVMEMDTCSNTFGVAPCTATGTSCYNTKSTCKDTPNYDRTTVEHKFSLTKKPLIGPFIRPFLTDYTELGTEIKDDKGIAGMGRVTLNFADDEDFNDVGFDNYRSTRSGFKGSFWKKFFARNRYYEGRTVLIKKGFVGLAEGSFKTEIKGIIDKKEGPNNGKVKLVLKDYLKKADKVKYPEATQGKVADNPLTSGATTINLDDAAKYETSGYIKIDDEIIKYTGKSSNQLTGCTRGAFSTTAASHTLDTKVDQVAGWENANPWNMIYGLLVDIVGFSVSDIDVADSESERDIWLSSYSFTGVVISSKNVSDIIKKICEECGAVMWWSNEEQKIKFRVLAPPSPDYYVKTLDDSTGIVSGSYNEENNEDSRKSIVIVNYNKSATDEDYASAIAASEDNKADVTEYGSHAVKSIDAWFITQESVATSLAERWLSQYVIPPRLASMKAELKDDEVKVGDIVEVNTDDILDAFGEQQHIMFRVLKKEKSGANELKFKIMDTYYGNTRYGFIAENTAADYDDATDYEKQFCYICDDDGTINGTDPGYLIIAL